MQFFLRGVVLPFQKGKALERGIEELSVSRVRVPLASADGEYPQLTLPEDGTVACGDALCRTDGTPVYATVAGQVEGSVVIQHPLYGSLLCADIAAEGDNTAAPLPVIPEEELTPEAILNIAREAAIYDELDGVPLWRSCSSGYCRRTIWRHWAPFWWPTPPKTTSSAPPPGRC